MRLSLRDSSLCGGAVALIQSNASLCPASAEGVQTMIGTRALSLTLLCMAIATPRDIVAASKYQLKQDPQAVAVAQSAFTAMGGAQAVAGYQDSLASGTATISAGGNSVSYAITVRSKGLRETRVELQMPKGTNVRIVNQGQGAILRPDGSVKTLDLNNTFYEHVNHVPLLSLLAEYASGNVNLLYKGVVQVQGQAEDVIEIDFVPNLNPINAPIFASMSRTLFFVNQTTRLVDKTQSTPLYEGDAKNTVTEEVYLTDYRSMSGLMVPFHQTVFTDGQLDSDITFTSVNFNVGLSDSEFALPQAR